MFKRLFNSSERIAYTRLRRVCARHAAEVHAKVRVADVLPIEGSGLPAPFFEFALQAHYDFIVMGPDHTPLFAVEFDGPLHDQHPQSERDAKKDGLSHRFGLPLIRIRSEHLERSRGRHDRLTELVEQWFATHVKSPKGRRNMENQPVCPICGDAMVEKPSKYGRFLGCIRYPDCRGSLDLPGTDGPTNRLGPRWAVVACSIGALLVATLLVLVVGLPAGPSQDCGRPESADGQIERPTTSAGSAMSLAEKLDYVNSLVESEHPLCPGCGRRMMLRRNSTTGEPFFGCSEFPRCRRTREVAYPR